jgi:hypothetical protein
MNRINDLIQWFSLLSYIFHQIYKYIYSLKDTEKLQLILVFDLKKTFIFVYVAVHIAKNINI